MSPLRWTLLFTLPLLALRAGLGCSAAESTPSATSPDGSAPGDPAPGTPTDDDAATGDDAGGGGGPRPSFCDGLALYASFDATFAAEVGGGDASVYGGAALVPTGRFGGSVALLPGTEGAWLYYSEQPGAFEFPAAEGSIAMWTRLPIDAPQAGGIYFRAVADVDAGTGLSLPVGLILQHTSPTRFGLKSEGSGGTLFDFPWASVKPHLRRDGLNHFAVAWRSTDAGGPTAYLAINGGTGERYDDAGPDASVFVDDAGNTTYHAVTSKVWGYLKDPTAVRLGGSVPPTAPNADIDELAVWNRVLSFEEMDALHRSPVALAAACKIGL